MTTIPDDAIDPEAAYQEWTRQYLWHIDQIPPLLETTSLLAAPSIGVSRGGSRFDRPQISGGGYFDNVPIVESAASTDANILWTTLHGYLHAVSAHAGSLPPLAQHPRLWRPPAGDAPPEARAHAIEATGWLADLVDHIIDWPDLAPDEDELFALVRRMKGRYRPAHTARRARPRLCGVCGEHAVVVDWVTPANGSPKPVQVGRCRTCGQTYQETAEAESTS